MLILVFSLLAMASATADVSRFPKFRDQTGVDPNSLQCDPEGLVPLLLPHRKDCEKFYMCAHGEEVPFSCPDGTIFDFERQTCNWPRDANCILRTPEASSEELDDEDGSGGGSVEWGIGEHDDVTNPPEISTRPPKPDQKPPKPDHKPDHKPPKPDHKPHKPDHNHDDDKGNHNHKHDEHHHEHDKQRHGHDDHHHSNKDGKHNGDENRNNLKCNDLKNAAHQEAHSSDCQRYWKCVNGHPHQFSCSDGLYFNHQTQQCDHEGNVKCNLRNDELANEFILA